MLRAGADAGVGHGHLFTRRMAVQGIAPVSARRGHRAIYWPRCPQGLTASASYHFVPDPSEG